MAESKAVLLKKVLSGISPTKGEAEKEKQFADALVARFKHASPPGSKVRLMGSVAKGTFLRGSNDIDVFLLLPKYVPRESFERVVKDCANKAFPKAKKEIAFAEHPYIRLWVSDKKIDLVPAYDIKRIDQMASSVDRSILHLNFILHNLPQSKKGEVLLLKKFLKSNGLYGAEIRVEGFSGYLCELLIIRYGGFLPALRAISKWKPPVRLQIGKSKAKEFSGACITFIDPVDPERNVAAIVSEENLKRLVSLAKRFLLNPSSSYFSATEADYQRKKTNDFLSARGKKNVLFFTRPKLVDDILWGQLKRLVRVMISSLDGMGFKADEWLVMANGKECAIFFRFRESSLGAEKTIKGPPLNMYDHCQRFKKSHPKARFIKKSGHLVAITKRTVRNVDQAFAQILKERHGFPSHIPIKIAYKT